MLLECTIEREGGTTVTVQRSSYDFVANEHGVQVCDINSGSHLDYLLKLPDFRIYKEPEIESEPIEFICDRCGNKFANAAGLSGHKRSKGYQDELIANQNNG